MKRSDVHAFISSLGTDNAKLLEIHVTEREQSLLTPSIYNILHTRHILFQE